MLPDSLIDSCMGFLPNVKQVTCYRTRDADSRANPLPLQARREDLSASEMVQFGDMLMGQEGCTFFFPVSQPGFERPRNKWLIVADGFDGTEWTVLKDDLGVQQRGVAVLAAKVIA